MSVGGQLNRGGGGGAGVSGGVSGGAGAAGVSGKSNTAGGGQSAGRGGVGGGGGVLLGGLGGTEGGAGGSEALDCDDGNACTTDTVVGNECQHAPRVCTATNPCLVAACDPARGCTTTNAAEGTACDDGRACTSGDACRAGKCEGALSTFDLEKSVMQTIPDGQEMCHGVQGELAVVFDVDSTVQFGELTLDIDFEHSYASELRVALRHEASGRTARVLWNPEAANAKAAGKFSFADGAAAFPTIQDGDVPTGTYAPEESFAQTFQGVAIGGAWTLLFSDTCEGDIGRVRSATLHLKAACP